MKFVRLFAKLSRPGNEMTFAVFESSCHLMSNRSKIEAILLSTFSKDTTSELAYS